MFYLFSKFHVNRINTFGFMEGGRIGLTFSVFLTDAGILQFLNHEAESDLVQRDVGPCCGPGAGGCQAQGATTRFG